MKQVLLVAAIYSLVLYQSQKKATEKKWPAHLESIETAQRPIAKAASLPLKLYQQSLQLRHVSNQKKGATMDLVFTRLSRLN